MPIPNLKAAFDFKRPGKTVADLFRQRIARHSEAKFKTGVAFHAAFVEELRRQLGCSCGSYPCFACGTEARCECHISPNVFGKNFSEGAGKTSSFKPHYINAILAILNVKYETLAKSEFIYEPSLSDKDGESIYTRSLLDMTDDLTNPVYHVASADLSFAILQPALAHYVNKKHLQDNQIAVAHFDHLAKFVKYQYDHLADKKKPKIINYVARSNFDSLLGMPLPASVGEQFAISTRDAQNRLLDTLTERIMCTTLPFEVILIPDQHMAGIDTCLVAGGDGSKGARIASKRLLGNATISWTDATSSIQHCVDEVQGLKKIDGAVIVDTEYIRQMRSRLSKSALN